MGFEIESEEGLIVIEPRKRAIKGYTTKRQLKGQIDRLKGVLELE